MNILAFVAASLSGAAYFASRKRIFDLFVIAYGGCIFYFLPLFIGSVPARSEPPTHLTISLPTGIYAVGIGLTASIFIAAALFDQLKISTPKIRSDTASRAGLSTWYLLFAFIGLFGSIRSGAIFNLDKLIVLKEVGYWFILFETSTALTVVDAFFYRMRAHFVLGTVLLLVDIFIGFRMITIMTVIACVLLRLGSGGSLRLWRRLPILGVGTAALFLAMVAVNPFRYALLPQLGISGETTLQNNSDEPAEPLAQRATKLVPRVLDFENIEPFVTQAILAEMIRHDFSCSPKKILNVAYIVPFVSLFFEHPDEFESEFKPTLFPDYKYGLAGNIWAEAFCRFGYVGIASAVITFLLSICATQMLMFRAFPIALPALALAGVFLTFYVHRNDLLFELLLIRRVLFVFGAAWLARFAWLKLRKALRSWDDQVRSLWRVSSG